MIGLARAPVFAAIPSLLLSLLPTVPAAATPFFFSTGNPDGKIATASRPDSPFGSAIETGDDFVLSQATTITSATFTGLITGSFPGISIGQVVVEIYRVFPNDSDVGRTSGVPPFGTPNVPARMNSPSDVEFADRASTSGNLDFTASDLGSFTVANSVQPFGINKQPNQTTGGDGSLTGEEVEFDVTFTTPLSLPADQYFFVPQVEVTNGDGSFFWLSAPRPIVSPGTPFSPDLQSWMRDGTIEPDWLRVGTDIVGLPSGIGFNAAFSLTGDVVVPEPASLSVLGTAIAGMGAIGWRRKRRHSEARAAARSPVSKRKPLTSRPLASIGAALGLVMVLTAGNASRADDICPLGPPTGLPSCQPKFNLNGYDKGAKTPINTCQTNTSSSPCAWADVSQETQNFLACRLETTGPIALCYYSGVPGEPNLTPSCTLSQDQNAAQCDCYKISEDNPPGAKYSYILITSILNKKVYEDTVSSCGPEGDKCLNATNIAEYPASQEAPVCAALRDKTLFTGADLISTFSPILINTKGITSVTCPTGGGANLYAGCMTAPCKNTGKIDPSTGLSLVRCTCPTYDGPAQVGNPQIKSYSCAPTPHVWSAAFSAPNTIPTEP